MLLGNFLTIIAFRFDRSYVMLHEKPNKKIQTRKHFAINDWVTNHSLVGQVVKMEQKLSEDEVWVRWSGYSIPMNEPVVNLHPLDYEGKDLAGMSLPNGEGYCHRLVYDEYSVQVEVCLEHKNSPQLWSLEKLARVQNGGKPQPGESELRTQNSELRTHNSQFTTQNSAEQLPATNNQLPATSNHSPVKNNQSVETFFIEGNVIENKELIPNNSKVTKSMSRDGSLGQHSLDEETSSGSDRNLKANSSVHSSEFTVLSSSETFIPLKNIRRDGGTQPRANINHRTVLEYVEDMKKGDSFPPVVVYYDGTNFWLCDGFHRAKAALKAGLNEIAAIVKQGTKRDAVLYSVGANAKHGLRRNNADKRRAVMRLLEDKEWSEWSNREIARRCGVSLDLVNRLRSSLNDSFSEKNRSDVSLKESLSEENKGEQNQSSLALNSSEENKGENKDTMERTYITKHGTVAKMNTANIGKGKKKKKEEPESPGTSLSIGQQVKVKPNNSYFSGQLGTITQILNYYSVIVAFENGERDVIPIRDLDLPQPQPQPVKKEIVIKEGLNYKAGNPGYGCKWYIEVTEENYKRLQEYQKKVGTATMDGALARFLDSEEERIKEELTPNTSDILVNLISFVPHLNQPQLTALLNACNQAITKQFNNSDSETISNQSVTDTFKADNEDYQTGNAVTTTTESENFSNEDNTISDDLESPHNQPLTTNKLENDEKLKPIHSSPTPNAEVDLKRPPVDDIPPSRDNNEIISLIDLHIKLLGWDQEEYGNKFINRIYGKTSRHLLSDEELLEFLNYLKCLYSPEELSEECLKYTQGQTVGWCGKKYQVSYVRGDLKRVILLSLSGDDLGDRYTVHPFEIRRKNN